MNMAFYKGLVMGDSRRVYRHRSDPPVGQDWLDLARLKDFAAFRASSNNADPASNVPDVSDDIRAGNQGTRAQHQAGRFDDHHYRRDSVHAHYGSDLRSHAKYGNGDAGLSGLLRVHHILRVCGLEGGGTNI